MRFVVTGAATLMMTALMMGLAPACIGDRPATSASTGDVACAGLSDAEIRDAVAELRTRTDRVERIYEAPSPKAPPRTAGAVVYVQATRQMTAQWLNRVIQCSAAGPARDRSPVALAGARGEVSPTATGFAVAVRSNDAVVAEEIVRRATAGAW
jgi:hypothetical protein